MAPNSPCPSINGGRKISYEYIFFTFLSCAVSFLLGTLQAISQTSCMDTEKSDFDAIVGRRVDKELSSSTAQRPFRFQRGLSTFVRGVVTIKSRDLIKNFDNGTPQTDDDTDALLFYSSGAAVPSFAKDAHKAKYESSDGIAHLNVTYATENCESLHIITVPTRRNQHCTAIVRNHESFHVQFWMREVTGKKIDYNTPLAAVSRSKTSKGKVWYNVPKFNDIKKHWDAMRNYFNHLDAVTAELKPIAEGVAKKNTIIVMTCNMGQSELLMNFVCNARAKSLDISNILVFPTDEETKELAEGLGLATFYDKRNFENLPQAGAQHYGDRAFVAMMFAKIVCVQLTNMLGYDVLFQDVDIVWYRNPLDYFHNETNPFYHFDMYFQDDGARSSRFAPTSANSGFYYVRNNDKTRHFFTSLLYHGDILLESHSHQSILIQLMAEHVSLYGLRVKVLDREMEEFPSGWHFHRRSKSNYMKKVMKGDVAAQIFHMCWTENKDNKLKFFQQMGEWYLKKECISKSMSSILGNNENSGGFPLVNACCLADAEVTCHYRDKPSKIPCKDSDPIDAGRRSFW